MYHEITEKIEEYEDKKYLMVDDNVLDNVLDRIKKIITMEIYLMMLCFCLTQIINCQMRMGGGGGVQKGPPTSFT